MDPLDVAAGYTSMAAQRGAAEVATTIMRKAMDEETSAAANLLQSLPPIGSLGHNIDIKA
jgi:hypothetical protein